MNEQLISFDTAVLAKKKGYTDVKNLHILLSGVTNCYTYSDTNKTPCRRSNYSKNNPHYLAPSQAKLQKWLRDKYKIHITITSISQESWQCHITKIGEILGKMYSENFYTYEEALENGLQLALNLLNDSND